MVDGAQNFTMEHHDSVEVRANQFAMELLMPEDVVNGLIEKRNLTNPSVLAGRFIEFS